jgi:hypothetical protein
MREQAETIALVAEVPTLFTRAVAICEEVVVEDGSESNKVALLGILFRAGNSSKKYPDPGAVVRSNLRQKNFRL